MIPSNGCQPSSTRVAFKITWCPCHHGSGLRNFLSTCLTVSEALLFFEARSLQSNISSSAKSQLSLWLLRSHFQALSQFNPDCGHAEAVIGTGQFMSFHNLRKVAPWLRPRMLSSLQRTRSSLLIPSHSYTTKKLRSSNCGKMQ